MPDIVAELGRILRLPNATKTEMKSAYIPRVYHAYKLSGIDRLGDIPAHWEMRRLRTVVDMRVSNVDKHIKDGELPVRLCNYVDVYKNDLITENIDFMRATATESEITRFKLELGDVIITKDSETWDDIGVPALVNYAADDLICGYHLALLRPIETSIIGSYLLLVLQTPQVSSQFSISASGVTRYGLTHDAIKSVLLPLPPPAEQAAIARYLDHADERIQRAISAKERLVELLTEQRQAVIHRAVTRGLDPNVRLKDSGIEWLGEVPEHWEVTAVKRHFKTQLGKMLQSAPVSPDDVEVPYLKAQHVHWNHVRVEDPPTMWATPQEMEQFSIQRGDLLIVEGGVGGVTNSAILEDTVDGYIIQNALHRVRSRAQASNRFLLFAMMAIASSGWFGAINNKATMPHFTKEKLNSLPIPFPPVIEQIIIVSHINEVVANTNTAIDNAQRQIDLLREYRTRLIADVVTGQVDVRDAVEVEAGLAVS